MLVITGAAGNTGSVAAESLLGQGEKLRVVGRSAERLERFTKKGAEAFLGDAQDEPAMARAFTGATAVYLVIPQALQRDDFRAYQERISSAYAAAVAEAGVEYAVSLSSIGAQHADNVGPIGGLHSLEEKLNRLPRLNVLHLRPTHFMENLFLSIEPIRTMGMLPSAFAPHAPIPMIATRDIGAVAAERLQKRDFSGHQTQELLGPRDFTMNEIASIIGNAIGKPGLAYTQVPLAMIEGPLLQLGFPRSSAALLLEMWRSVNDGLVAPTEARSARNTTPTTIESFVAQEFAPRFQARAARA